MRFFDTRLGRCATLLALGGGVALYAQGTQTASATITVVDRSGSPIANARVRLTSPSMMAERVGATNASGVFVARLLPPGTYTIEVVRDGFQTTKDTRAIGMDQHYQPRIVMQPVGSTTVEIVSTSMSSLDPTDVKTASNYDAKRIDTLPTGRSIVAMAQLTPGVSSGANDIQIRGSNGTGNLYLVDGQNLHDNVYNSLAFPVINDSIEETQVITGAISAEYGNIEGGVINTITKSGGNEFEGLIRIDLSNSAWNAVRPFQSRSTIENVLNEYKTYTLGGYIIKDRLWFYASYYSVDSSSAYTIPADSIPSTPNAPGGANAGYMESVKRRTQTFKLTYRFNDDHSVIGTYSAGTVEVENNDYISGELDTLVPQTEDYSMFNVSWRAIWSPNLNTEVRFGAKNMKIAAGGTKGLTPTIYDLDYGYLYNNGLFNFDDGGDNRDNQTANIKGSYFLDWNGMHEIDFGLDYYKGTRQAQNMQSPTNNIVYVFEWDREYKMGIPYGMEHYESTDASADQTTIGLYINDRWKVNNNLALQVGVRWDQYSATAGDVSGTIASASGISPRLGATYDLFGDQQWIFKASYCIYNGPVLEAVSGAVSGAGNPVYYFYYIKPEYESDLQGLDVLGNLDCYDTENIDEYDNPTVNVKINSSLKAPNVHEMQLSAAYSFQNETWGDGIVSLTAVQKTWKNMIDYSAGMHGLAYDANIDDYFYIKYWDNSPDAERKYKALELVVDYVKDNFHFSGNSTWSTLEGNYDGEAGYSPGAAQGIHWYDQVDFFDGAGLQRMYDVSQRTPYGYLTGHRPLAINANFDYTIGSPYGRTVIGFVYRFRSGSHYSHARTNRAVNLNPDLPGQFGGTWTEFKDGKRGEGVFNASAYHDLAVTHDFNLFKVAGTQVTAFAKLVIYNFFNHQQMLTWDVNYRTAPVGTPLNENWVANNTTTFNRATGASNYGSPRQYSVSAGIRF